MSKTDKRKKTRSKAKAHSTVPAFLLKTYEILEDPSHQDIACWNKEGSAFIVKNVTEFSDKILPNFFKHNNFASFVRQLNMYDFHKTRHENNENEFCHKLFKRGQKNLLRDIKRKITEAHAVEQHQLVPANAEKFKKEANHFSGELQTLKGRQAELEKFSKTIFTQNTKLLKENKLLWGELTKNKDKYERKIEKLMMFVFSVTQYSGNNAIESAPSQKSICPAELPGSFDELASDTELMKADLADSENKARSLLGDKKDHGKFLKGLGKYFHNKGDKSNIDKLTDFAKRMGDFSTNQSATMTPKSENAMTLDRDSPDTTLPHENTRGRKNGKQRIKIPEPSEDISDDDFFQELPSKFVKTDKKVTPVKVSKQYTTRSRGLSLDPFVETPLDRSFNKLDSINKESPLLPPSMITYNYQNTANQDFFSSPQPVQNLMKADSLAPFRLLEDVTDTVLNQSREEPLSLLSFPQTNPDNFISSAKDNEQDGLGFGIRNDLSFDENTGMFGGCGNFLNNREGLSFDQ